MLDEEIMIRSFDEGDNKQKDYMRVTHFDKSNAFGFGKKEDYNLGKLADENKKDMQKAIRHIPDFRKTNVGFNKRK